MVLCFVNRTTLSCLNPRGKPSSHSRVKFMPWHLSRSGIGIRSFSWKFYYSPKRTLSVNVFFSVVIILLMTGRLIHTVVMNNILNAFKFNSHCRLCLLNVHYFLVQVLISFISWSVSFDNQLYCSADTEGGTKIERFISWQDLPISLSWMALSKSWYSQSILLLAFHFLFFLSFVDIISKLCWRIVLPRVSC